MTEANLRHVLTGLDRIFRSGLTTFWNYTPPPGHLSSHLADPAYWTPHPGGRPMPEPGDWLFVTHCTSDGRLYNILYCFTSSPFGIWAQQLLSSVPPISSLPR